MPANSTEYRYHLPKKAIKGDCPQCGPKHRRTLSRYVDSQAGEVLPEEFGRCDRESNCGYHLSPYHSGPQGTSYADEVFEHWKTANPLPPSYTRHTTPTPCPVVEEPIYTLPDEVFRKTLGHYDSNQFATLLCSRFGQQKAEDLLKRFQIGTSKRWPGATVFWIIDEQQRVRGGQVVLFREDWHRSKDHFGSAGSCLSWQYRQRGESIPEWLEQNETWPVTFGLHQLYTEPTDKPVAIVEACKTAVVCAGHFPQFIWLAFGAKSYAKPSRLAGLKGRRVVLYPDLNAFDDWSKRAEAMRAEGYRVRVSSLLEDNATEQQRKDGLDLADFLLMPAPPPRIVTTLTDWKPGTVFRPDPALIEFL
ncbi:hypothetical protein J2I47_15000 [Fibrella sp. HMF5335]|uniref:Toprim domain-containing protein n=1 Tax=Fibrella rubiginis TaxID=2817060 RepID=A0A939GF67_9BACT|nr:DUF6371 domain-containing protein [Fibrella rubiginis]MBO0937864.1 hypothetical protein [Fibrella rubiginis]